MNEPFTYRNLLDAARADARELVRVERRDARALVTLVDPARLNALTPALMLQLHLRLAELAAEPDLRAIVITGTDPAFCAGGDLDLIARGGRGVHEPDTDGTAEAWRWIRGQFGGVARLIAGTDTAFIAAVNGAAAGVGLAIALACDVILASEKAVLVPAFGRLGLVPEVGTSWMLTRRLGYQGAFAFFVSGKHVPAREAFALGLVQEVHPHEALLAAANEWCDRALALPPHALEMTKPLLRAAADAPWAQSLATEEFAEANCFSWRGIPDAAAAVRRRLK